MSRAAICSNWLTFWKKDSIERCSNLFGSYNFMLNTLELKIWFTKMFKNLSTLTSTYEFICKIDDVLFPPSPARECPAPLEYSECTSSCPRTCKTLYLVEPDECKMCISGCQCPAGTFLQNGQCVTPQECMCEFNKKQYKHGETIKQRCNLW